MKRRVSLRPPTRRQCAWRRQTRPDSDDSDALSSELGEVIETDSKGGVRSAVPKGFPCACSIRLCSSETENCEVHPRGF